jgi:poly [ADP-ribose] polymerase 10/14/15
MYRFTRRWVFHGCPKDIVPKIIQQGFNRSFCGANATLYGKGTYFARDAAYSASPRYSREDAETGLCYMFLCRAVVGEYHVGRKDQVTPDVRDAEKHLLYDSTVALFPERWGDAPYLTKGDDLSNPSVYVTYHDAQAYPEYLVAFKRKEDPADIARRATKRADPQMRDAFVDFKARRPSRAVDGHVKPVKQSSTSHV